MDNFSDSATPAEDSESTLDKLLRLCDQDDHLEDDLDESLVDQDDIKDCLAEYLSEIKERPWYESNEMPWREEQEPPEVINFNESGYNLTKLGTFSYVNITGSLPSDGLDSFRITTIHDMAECYILAAECYPQSFSEERDFWVTAAEESDARWREIENAINENTTVSDLIAAGIIKASEAEFTVVAELATDPSRSILRRVVEEGDFKKMKLLFDNGRLCVNGAPTKILERDVQDLYNGLFGLRSYQYAMDEVVKTLVDKLTILFGVNDEEPLVEETSSEDE